MIHGGRIAFEIARLNRKASNTDASQLCLGKPGVCRLGCVEFIYTSVSGTDTLSRVTSLQCGRSSTSSGHRLGIVFTQPVLRSFRHTRKKIPQIATWHFL